MNAPRAPPRRAPSMISSSLIILAQLLAGAEAYGPHSRMFTFVPKGSQMNPPPGQAAIAVSSDGRIPGATLELSHWEGNDTPQEVYADTSTEICLNFARAVLSGEHTLADGRGAADFADATIMNNHYNTDGVLAVWSLLNPEDALRNAALLVSGAEAGDFAEWSSEEGVKLDCALCALQASCGGSEEDAFRTALEALPELIDDLENRGGQSSEKLWGPGWNDAVSGYNAIQDGRVRIVTTGTIALIGDDEDAICSAYALHRGLREAGMAGDQPGAVERVLRIQRFDWEGGDRFNYHYSKPGYGWVTRLARRKPVLPVDNMKVVNALNGITQTQSEGRCWAAGGGLADICQTVKGLDVPPPKLLEVLKTLDEGAA